MSSSSAAARWVNGSVLAALAASAASLGVALAAAWNWPLVGDAALMRYAVFLLRGGMAPYREVVDINLPGSYALEALAMRVFGAGAAGLRLYDAALCGVVCLCAVVLSERGWRARACGAISGLLFASIHLRDGVVQAGQRDLAMAALALAALVLLLRLRGAAGVLGFELLAGFTLVVKPTLFPIVFLPLLDRRLRRDSLSRGQLVAGACALLAPTAAVWVWLWSWDSVPAFLQMLGGLERTHSELARRGIGFLLGHAATPVALLVAPGLVAWAILRFKADEELMVLAAAAGCGLISFLVQRKGFPYQRYTFLALALVCLFRVAARDLDSADWSRWAAIGIVGVSGFWFAPHFAWQVTTFDRTAPFEKALSADLQALGAGAGEVQCLDTVGGCVATLNRMGLRQSTGFLYDCYAYVGADTERDAYRSRFLAAIKRAKPKAIVLSSQYCLAAPDDIARVSRWPELEETLSERYRVGLQWVPGARIRWWNEMESPPGYRIYVRR